MNAEQPNRGKSLAITGVFLQLGTLIGMAGTVIGMFRAFNTLGASGTSDPQQLAESIGTVLIYTAIGLSLSLIGLVLICIALFASSYRAVWLFWFLFIYGCILLCIYPAGTVIGVLLLIYCLINKDEFFKYNESKQST